MYGSKKSDSPRYTSPLLFALRNVARSKKRLRRFGGKKKGEYIFGTCASWSSVQGLKVYLRLSKFYRGIRCIFEVNRLGSPSNTGHLSTCKTGPPLRASREGQICLCEISFRVSIPSRYYCTSFTNAPPFFSFPFFFLLPPLINWFNRLREWLLLLINCLCSSYVRWIPRLS